MRKRWKRESSLFSGAKLVIVEHEVFIAVLDVYRVKKNVSGEAGRADIMKVFDDALLAGV
jgi:hypothetical protein